MCETIIQQDFIVRKKEKENKVMQENVPKTSVEQTKGNVEFYFYLYPLGT